MLGEDGPVATLAEERAAAHYDLERLSRLGMRFQGRLARTFALAAVSIACSQTAGTPRANSARADAVSAVPAQSQSSTVPNKLTDAEFWQFVIDFSEPGGYFRSDNFVSNENSLQYVIPELLRTTSPGGVYLGVAPDQNFTYLIALKPRLAFIIDIRRQNLVHHLMYKAMIEMANDRADFVSLLFARARPAGVTSESTTEALFSAFETAPFDTLQYAKNLAAITKWLTERHKFALTPSDLQSLDYIYRAFATAGPDITYGFPNGGGRGFGRWPTYAQMTLETDGLGNNRSYLGTEANFRVLKEMQANNQIVPLVGNFSGDKTVRTVGKY
jgi:hypothetical protein